MKIMQLRKKPAASRRVQRKPSIQDKVSLGLTQSALDSLEGQSEHKVDRFLEDLNDQNTQALWKKFERSRDTEGCKERYDLATSGAGGRSKRSSLLKIWLQSGQSTKSSLWQDSVFELTSSKALGTTKVWQPLHYMLNHKYGQKELKARVQSGSIQIRANPRDPRFPEFCEISEFERQETQKSGKIQVKPKGQTISWNDFDELQKLDLTGQDNITWANGPAPDTTNPLVFDRLGKGSTAKSISDKVAVLRDVGWICFEICAICSITDYGKLG